MSLTGASVYVGHQVTAVSTTDRVLNEGDHIELYARELFKTYHAEKDWWNSMLEEHRTVWRNIALRKWPEVREARLKTNGAIA